MAFSIWDTEGWSQYCHKCCFLTEYDQRRVVVFCILIMLQVVLSVVFVRSNFMIAGRC